MLLQNFDGTAACCEQFLANPKANNSAAVVRSIFGANVSADESKRRSSIDTSVLLIEFLLPFTT
jgi:hypothetical protein